MTKSYNITRTAESQQTNCIACTTKCSVTKKKQKNYNQCNCPIPRQTYHCTTSHTTGCQSSIGTSNKYANKHKTATKRESYSDYHCQIEAGLECKLLVHRVLTNRTLPLFDQNHEYEKKSAYKTQKKTQSQSKISVVFEDKKCLVSDYCWTLLNNRPMNAHHLRHNGTDTNN